MSEANYSKSDLRFLLPLEPQQTVLVFGEIPELVEMIRTTNITCVNIVENDQTRKTRIGGDKIIFWRENKKKLKPLPLPDQSIDHILVPFCAFQATEWVFSDFKRLLKPGGQIFLGVKSKKYWLYRITWLINFFCPSNLSQLETLESIQKLLGMEHFRILQVFGVYKTLNDPRYLVPLEDSDPAHYFFDHMVTPFSWGDRIRYCLAKIFARKAGWFSLFPNIVLLVQRK